MPDGGWNNPRATERGEATAVFPWSDPVSVPPEPPDLAALLAEEERHERSPWLKAATLLGPIAVSAAILVTIGLLFGWGLAGRIAGAAVAIFTVAGKFAVLASESFGFTPYEIAALIAYMDLTIGTILVLNLPAVYRIPRVGPMLEDLAEHGHYMLEQRPWLARVTFFGVILFVMFPLSGTGAIGGSIFGRLLGLARRKTLIAIACGAVVGSFTMAFFADRINSAFPPEVRDSWQFKAVGIAVVLVIVAVITWRGRALSRQLKERRLARRELARQAQGEG